MAQNFLCQTVNKKDGIRVVHLTCDHDPSSQPIEMLINTPADQYQSGDVWLVEMTLLSRPPKLN